MAAPLGELVRMLGGLGWDRSALAPAIWIRWHRTFGGQPRAVPARRQRSVNLRLGKAARLSFAGRPSGMADALQRAIRDGPLIHPISAIGPMIPFATGSRSDRSAGELV